MKEIYYLIQVLNAPVVFYTEYNGIPDLTSVASFALKFDTAQAALEFVNKRDYFLRYRDITIRRVARLINYEYLPH